MLAVETRTVLREATLADVPTLVAMGHRFVTESDYAGRIGDNPAQMQALATQLITGESSVVLVAERDGALIGMLGMLVYAHHISGAQVAGEVFWWVNPEDRGTAGVRLLRAAERWGRDRGAATMQMIAPSPRVGALYVRLGYDPVETTYQKDLTSWR